MRNVVTALVALALSACGGPSAPATPAASASAAGPSDGPAPAASDSPVKPTARDPKELLSTCTEKAPAPAEGGDDNRSSRSDKDRGLCLPDAGLVARICDGLFPDAALVMFGGKSLFSRVYLKGATEGWNADSGKSARARLFFQEEMLVLKRRAAPKNGIVVGAGGGYLVMRWDGNCYTLDDGEVSTTKPASPKNAPLAWNMLEPPTKDALLKAPAVLAAFQKRGKECKGVTSGIVSKTCEIADAALAAAVVDEVRKGIALPMPAKLP